MCLATACLAICKACCLPTLKDGLYKRSSSEPGYSEGKKTVKASISPPASVFLKNKKANP